jgi:hypothetical protein
MQIYRWDSELLQQYSQGDLIALADSPEQAREMLRAGLEGWIEENRPWEIHCRDREDDSEGYDKLVSLFEADIAKEPTTHKTLWMLGSD